MKVKPLTPRQRQVFKFIKKYIDKYGYAPIYQDIAKAINLNSYSTVYNHIKSLERKGYIRRMKGITRGIEILVEKEPSYKDTVDIPLLGYITSKAPLEEGKDDSIFISIPLKHTTDINIENSFALMVKGDGLVSEGMLDGDYILLEYKETAKDGSNVLVQLDNNIATIRKIEKENGKYKLTSRTNPLLTLIVDSPKISGIVKAIYRFY